MIIPNNNRTFPRAQDADDHSWDSDLSSDTSYTDSDTDSDSDSDHSITVEYILSKRLDRSGRLEYLVKWRGLPHAYNSWEPAQDLRGIDHLIRDFELVQRL